jgi:hypothetical protein
MSKIIMVHGFNYDPADSKSSPDGLFTKWETMLAGHKLVRHAWGSVPMTMTSLFRAWVHGKWNRYRYAWAQAEEESKQLATRIKHQGKCSIVCHSLGSRVVLLALENDPWAAELVERVLILNGADYSSHGRDVACLRSEIEFFNMCVRDDDVISKLARFAPGKGAEFLGTHGSIMTLPNWIDVVLDAPEHWLWAAEEHGWHIRGDNPEKYSDHCFSYEWSGNYEMFRQVMSGKLVLGEIPRCQVTKTNL